MSNPTVPAAAEGMSEILRILETTNEFSRLSEAERGRVLSVVEALKSGVDASAMILGQLGAEAAAPLLAEMSTVTGTTSDRVNALFSRYAAIEREQHQAPDNDPHADALGHVAMAVRDLIFEIRDRSCNADLIAARIMLDLMLCQPWSDMGVFEWTDEERDALGTLECVADATTGTVRQEARRALATIGVEIEADPRT